MKFSDHQIEVLMDVVEQKRDRNDKFHRKEHPERLHPQGPHPAFREGPPGRLDVVLQLPRRTARQALPALRAAQPPDIHLEQAI